MTTSPQDTDLRAQLLTRIGASPEEVWTPSDFADLGKRAAVDKALQHLVAALDARHAQPGQCASACAGRVRPHTRRPPARASNTRRSASRYLRPADLDAGISARAAQLHRRTRTASRSTKPTRTVRRCSSGIPKSNHEPRPMCALPYRSNRAQSRLSTPTAWSQSDPTSSRKPVNSTSRSAM